MTQIEKIKAEIEGLLKCYKNDIQALEKECYTDNVYAKYLTLNAQTKIDVCHQILSFINSLHQESVSEDLEILAIKLEETIGTSPHSRETIKDFFQKAVQKYMNCLRIANREIGSLVEENYRLKEKQGEQSQCMVSTEAKKYETEFMVGDWIVDKFRSPLFIAQITDIENEICFIKDRNGDEGYETLHGLNEDYRYWTIQDAQDGDVLACPNDAGDRDVVFIFKNINSDEGWVFCFCAIDANGCFCTNNDYVGNINSTNISPATKEQRDTLEKALAEAGYEWDAAKKELKKISKTT